MDDDQIEVMKFQAERDRSALDDRIEFHRKNIAHLEATLDIWRRELARLIGQKQFNL